MSDDKTTMVVKTEIAKPLHYQQLENSLNIGPFLSVVEEFLKQPTGEECDASSESEPELAGVDAYTGETIWNGVTTSKQDRMADKLRLYNFANVGPDRQWLQDTLLTDTSDSSPDDDSCDVTEDHLREMLKQHVYTKKYRSKFYNRHSNHQFQYYSSGLLSNYDKFPEHQQATTGTNRKKKIVSNKREKLRQLEVNNIVPEDNKRLSKIVLEDENAKPIARNKRNNHKRKSSQNKAAEIMAHRRRKIWANMAKKEVGKVQRYRINNHKEILTSCKRVANYCMKNWRQKAMQSQKNMKEIMWRAKRLTREMQVYWKRFERVERETRRRMEREAEEQRKLDVELMEAKRQQRKLNFLITQTELYAHFMSRKLGGGSTEDQLRILSQLEEEVNPRLVSIDSYDSEAEKDKVRKKVEKAFTADEARTREFGLRTAVESDPVQSSTSPSIEDQDKPQPKIFRGNLKGYQLKGMTWLVNLYDQGINGILADEMGLGKTVQSIAFLCHIAEKYSVWGPFLIISPASTLHNWQQEMQRFVPDFKVVPYWGNQQDRKILRQFWDQKGLHTKEASFHVVITSYQLVISDFKYFNRIKWQYLILDEAQAIKSTSSMRWKLLLGFNCRNRLLLSGTPIQNSMAELWALLHFIMPSMFDSHDEFNEWFSKDIESHAEHKTNIDEKHLYRLHMILKPFMLRRVKTDVENELSDKIEIMVYCPLTTRQKRLYTALKKKIRIEDLLHSSGSSYASAQNITSNLMNLVMQFRKVCNHPELFERREPRSPFIMKCEDYVVPRLLTNDSPLLSKDSPPSLQHLLCNFLSIFHPQAVHNSIFGEKSSTFSFSRILKISPAQLYRIVFGGLLCRWKDALQNTDRLVKAGFNVRQLVQKELIFTSHVNCIYGHNTEILYSMQETLEHRILRSKKTVPSTAVTSRISEASNDTSLLPEFPHIARKPQVLECQQVYLPSFLQTSLLKVEVVKSREMFSSSRRWAWNWSRHVSLENKEGYEIVWFGRSKEESSFSLPPMFQNVGGLSAASPRLGWANIAVPDKQTLVTDAGKLYVLDNLLSRLKQQGHRALIYSQMTRMIDLLEEYMWFRKHTYMRLDGSSKISDRRDMVADFQTRADIFVFLLSTRAGGLGINLTAADTVIFYDSDWNPTVDQQAMDRAHRLGQTKQVTVYRLICKGTIEERIMQRAQEKSEIQRMVISGGNFKPDTLKPKEVVSLLLDDAEIEQKYRQKQAERRMLEESRQDIQKERDRKRKHGSYKDTVKHVKTEDGLVEVYQGVVTPENMSANEDGSQSAGFGEGNEEQHSSPSTVSSKESQPSEPSTVPRHSQHPAERARAKRGRPPRNAGVRASGLSRPPISMPPIVALGGSSNLKRGPGRPRLKPVGPSNQGGRGIMGRLSSSRGTSHPNRGSSKKHLPVPIRAASASCLLNQSQNNC
ncbi:chromatin-remodeling ATPase INO80 isoform X3 [Rhodnius prolixus]|uniref:chromatin-remodeling ATPase INO80 isoform X3 n=1 Tax=Rhodnius prolixus TaxID=13249 RepID=UPI003D18C7B1